MQELRSELRDLYYARTGRSRIFHLVLFTIDLIVVIYFLMTVRIPHESFYRVVDLAIFVLFAIELAARFWVDRKPRLFFFRLSTIADLIVLASLIIPLLIDNLGFLRIVRTLRFARLFRISGEIYRLLPAQKRAEDVVTATINLAVFLFVVTSTVWVLEVNINPEIDTWIDALYFSVSTLTTTGYGDITLKDPLGRFLSVFIMIFGVALFLRLAQAIFRPFKVEHECDTCGLMRHDPDASHCKHCGSTINIRTEGNW